MRKPCVNCIVPPHMIEAIKLRGDASMRAMAERLELSTAPATRTGSTATSTGATPSMGTG